MADQKIDFQITAQDMFTAVMNGVVAGMEKVKKSVDQIGTATKQSADQMSQAFKTLNIRSAFDIKAEQDKIISAFNQIKASGTASTAEMARAQDAMKKKLQELQGELSNTSQAGQRTGAALGDMFKGAGLATFYFNNIKMAAQSAWQALLDVSGPAMAMEKMNAQFRAASGSSALAAKDIAFVRAESQRLGLVFQDTAGSFAKFAAGTRNSSLEGDKAKEIFSAVAEASTALRLSTDETNGILLAFTQILGKGKVSAEELNQVAERLPGALDLISRAMGMTTREFRKAAEDGRVLSAEVLERIPKALRDLYGDAAAEAAAGPAAQLNRLKTAVFELMAVLGQKPMKVMAQFAGALAGLADAAKTAITWLSSNAWGQSLSALGSGIGFVAAALTVAAGAYAAYTAATWAATTATGAFTASMLANPLVLAFAAAVAGVAAALSALSDAFLDSGSASKKSTAEMRQSVEEARKAAAERKRIEDAYEKAVGVSLERQFAKRSELLEQDRRAVEEKFYQDFAAAKGNATEEQRLTERLLADKSRIENSYYADLEDIRSKDLKRIQEADDAKTRSAVEHLKRLGQLRDADALDIAAKNRAELRDLEQHYKQIEDTAKANGSVLVGIEQEKAAAIEQLRRRQALDAAQRGLEEGRKELDALRNLIDSRAAMLQAAAGNDLEARRSAQVEIDQMEIGYTRRRYQAAAAHFQDVAAFYPKNSEQYRASLAEMAAAHKSYLDTSTAAYRKYADEIQGIDRAIADYRMSFQQKIADLQQRGMTDAQKYADNQRRFEEALSKGREARARGDFETAEKYARQAEDLAGRLMDKKVTQATKLEEVEKKLQERLADITRQRADKQSDQARQQSEMEKARNDAAEERRRILAEEKNTQEAIAETTRALLQVEELFVGIQEEKRKQNVDALEKLKEIQSMQLDPKTLLVAFDEGALGEVRQQITALTRDETKTIYIRTVEQRAFGGPVGMSRGGKLPGDSLIDSIPVLARPGEWFIRNESAKFWGDGFMAAINAPFSAAGQKLRSMFAEMPKFATGGQVAAPVDMGNITITVGSGAFPVQGEKSVLASLRQELRHEMMRRPQ